MVRRPGGVVAIPEAGAEAASGRGLVAILEARGAEAASGRALVAILEAHGGEATGVAWWRS